MFESYPNIQYDAKTRRINRWMKVIGGTIAVLLVLGFIAMIAAANEASDRPVVVNDTSGRVVCYALVRNSFTDSTSVQATGSLRPGDREKIPTNSRCAVFNASGDYVGCFAVVPYSKTSISASSNNSRVKAEVCVYPR